MRRRHGDELDAAIRAAVLGLLAEHGPSGVTMEAVAAAAADQQACAVSALAGPWRVVARHAVADRDDGDSP